MLCMKRGVCVYVQASTVPLALEVLSQTAGGLHFLHTKTKMTHRDFRADNVLVASLHPLVVQHDSCWFSVL